ncbi:MAG: tetratricopeptide repeat protein [Polyangiales bacterium]
MSIRPLACIGRALACVVTLGMALASVARADESALEASVHALEANDIAAAERALDALPQREAMSAEATFQRGLVHFYAGRYAQSVNAMEQAVADAPRSPQLPEWRRLLSWAVAARDITKDFAETRSPDGRYVVLHPKGEDAVLVPYALDALQAADRAIERGLGIRLPAPIRLEVYPSARTLAEVSSLTLEHIRTTGTVALCKWNRLMIASPRSLLYGYPWLDTINHELVHLALSYASRNHAPVWFHEGLAKLFERTWRGLTPGAYLAPPTKTLLLNAASEKRLIAFDRMHPSIAMLPSQEDAALAFAQVVTFLESFRERFGDAGLTRTIELLADGQDVRLALAKVASEGFAELESKWRNQLSAKEPALPKASTKELKLRFVESGATDESLDVSEGRARKHLRVGDLLWGRRRTLAAAREYEVAQKFAPTDPILASRVARASLVGEKPERALSAVDAALREHPQHAPLHALRGASLIALKRDADARDPLREAIALNPYDPAPHCQLGRLDVVATEREREARACALLGGQ